MDHSYIDDNQVSERYVTGRLSPEDRTLFEDHFLGCPRCQENLETAEGLRRSLADLAADAVVSRQGKRPGLPGWLSAFTSSPRLLALAASLFVAVSVSGVLLLGELGRTRRDLQSVTRASAESRKNEEDLRRTVESERRAREDLAERLRTVQSMPLGAAVFTLNLTRGGDVGPPENRIVLTESPGWLVLVTDRPGPGTFRRFRFRLSTTDRRPVGDALAPSSLSGDQLAVAFPSSLLAPGDYRLIVEGLSPDGRAETLATYAIRAIQKP